MVYRHLQDCLEGRVAPTTALPSTTTTTGAPSTTTTLAPTTTKASTTTTTTALPPDTTLAPESPVTDGNQLQAVIEQTAGKAQDLAKQLLQYFN